MKPYYDQAGITIYNGDCREALSQLEPESVHCVVTSPPYWGLRDYGTGTWEGGSANCDHVIGEMRRGLGLSESVASPRGGGHKIAECEDIKARETCPKCGARRVDRQIGLEETLHEYLVKMVAIFRDVYRALRPDGTLWLNMGDSYATGTRGHRTPTNRGKHGYWENPAIDFRIDGKEDGLKPKDLVGMPWRLALALQADGWYLRQDIIWHKPNPMPESVTDRCTKAHEYIFLLSKSERYYFDQDAIKEPVTGIAHARGDGVNPKALATPAGWDTSPGSHGKIHKHGRNSRIEVSRDVLHNATRKDRARASNKSAPTDMHNGIRPRNVGNGADSMRPSKGVPNMPRPKQNASFSAAVNELVFERNKRSVWTVATFPFPEAHFATFPPDLIKPCILAGAPAGGVILDPFTGSGTTAVVAQRFGRRFVGCELNESYCAMATKRFNQGMLAFA